MARLNSKIEKLNKQLEPKMTEGHASKRKSEDTSANALLQAFGIEGGDDHTKSGKGIRPIKSLTLTEKSAKIAKLGRTMTILMQREYPLTWKRILGCDTDAAPDGSLIR